MNSHPAFARRRIGGFNLIELLIVVAIVGILAAIGFPAYQNYARQAKRADAHEALTRAAQLQERYFADTGGYAGNAQLLGYATTALSPGGFWTLTAATITGGYILTAAPNAAAPHADADCTSITLDAQGIQGSNPGSVDECW